jgi:hypothetical protein
MLSYHNDLEIKRKYIARVKKHRELDHLEQRLGWRNDGKTKGCAIGCTLEAYDHSRYPIELGLPEWLARLEDVIFESLPREQAMYWPEKLLEAIPVGVDVEPVRHRLAIRRMDRLIALQTKALDKHPGAVNDAIVRTIEALETVKRYHETELGIYTVPVTAQWAAYLAYSAANSAMRAARLAEYSARSAADSAENSARSAAYSARSAYSGADSARLVAESARSAADSAYSAAWEQEANDLLELLAECKP